MVITGGEKGMLMSLTTYLGARRTSAGKLKIEANGVDFATKSGVTVTRCHTYHDSL